VIWWPRGSSSRSPKTFANVLDVLIMVDLRQTPRHTLMRYLGGDGTKAFSPTTRSRTANPLS
jgi:hypothetical protein